MNYVSRKEWGASRPQSTSPIKSVRGIGVHYNGPNLNIRSHSECAGRVKGVQNFHMGPKRKWHDIAYSWIVCPHGVIYEGRGWGVRTAANGTRRGNDHNYAVMFLGGNSEVTEEAKRGIKQVIAAAPSQVVHPHSYFKATSCPGNNLRQWIAAGLPLGSDSKPSFKFKYKKVIRRGDKGLAVREWQNALLKDNGRSLPRFGADGDFGNETLRATRNFQRSQRIKVDGIVGPQSRRAMERKL